MSKKIILIVIAIVVVLGIGYLIYQAILNKPVNNSTGGIPEQAAEEKIAVEPLNATYLVENQPVTLILGKAEKEIVPGSTSKITTMVFGSPTMGDLNDDGADDAALILTQNSGGSGTFYYVAASVLNNKDGKTTGTNGILLGDRISIQSVLIDGGTITVNYSDRKKNGSMSVQPSVAITKYFGVRKDGVNEILFEKPNTEKFNEYFQEVYLAKLPAGSEFDPFNIIKTTSFTAGEQFCSSLTMKKDIPAGSFGMEVYDIGTKQDVQAKGTFPQALKQGGSVGCENLQYPIGKYEFRLYIDDILVAILPFEVK